MDRGKDWPGSDPAWLVTKRQSADRFYLNVFTLRYLVLQSWGQYTNPCGLHLKCISITWCLTTSVRKKIKELWFVVFAFHRGEIILIPVKSKLLRWYQEIQRQGITERRRALMSQWDLVLKPQCFPFLSLGLPGMYLPHCFLFSPSSDFLSFAEEDYSRFRMFLLIMNYSGSLLSHKGFTQPLRRILSNTSFSLSTDFLKFTYVLENAKIVSVRLGEVLKI